MPQASGFPCSSPSTHSHGSSETWENQLETLNAMAVRVILSKVSGVVATDQPVSRCRGC